MKRIGNLYHKIYDIDNIKLAHKNARIGKTHYVEVIEVDNNIEYYCNLLQESLKNKTFQNSPYEVFIKQDKNNIPPVLLKEYYGKIGFTKKFIKIATFERELW